MAYLKDDDLFSDIKQGKFAKLYFLYGQEKYFLLKAASMLVKKAVAPEFEGFNLNRISGEKLDLMLLEDMTDALPMMSQKRCILLSDLDVNKMDEASFSKFMSILQNISDTTMFILCEDIITVDVKKPGKNMKKLMAFFAKEGVVCEFSLKDKQTLKRELCKRAKKAYIEMEMDTASFLIDRCSLSYMTLINEMDKLISYVQNGEITKKDVESCCVKSIDSSSFDLAKSVLSNNFDRAYHLLDELFFQRQEGIAIVAALSMSFIDIYRVKCGIIAAKTQGEIIADFKYPINREFAVKKAFGDVTKFSVEHIHFCIKALFDADIELKSSKLNSRLILEQMLGKMLLMSISERAI